MRTEDNIQGLSEGTINTVLIAGCFDRPATSWGNPIKRSDMLTLDLQAKVKRLYKTFYNLDQKYRLQEIAKAGKAYAEARRLTSEVTEDLFGFSEVQSERVTGRRRKDEVFDLNKKIKNLGSVVLPLDAIDIDQVLNEHPELADAVRGPRPSPWFGLGSIQTMLDSKEDFGFGLTLPDGSFETFSFQALEDAVSAARGLGLGLPVPVVGKGVSDRSWKLKDGTQVSAQGFAYDDVF